MFTNALFDCLCVTFFSQKRFSKCSSIWPRRKGSRSSAWGDSPSCRPTITTSSVSRLSWWIHWRPQSVERWQANIKSHIMFTIPTMQIITLDRFPHKILKGLCGCFADLPRIPARRVHAALQQSHETERCSERRLHQTRHCESLRPQITDQTHWIQISKFCSKYLFHIICISSLHPNPMSLLFSK